MSLLVLAALMALGVTQAAAGGFGSMPIVQEVLVPTPPGTQAGSQMFLQATVLGSGSTEVTFYLDANPAFDNQAVEIASTTVSASSGTAGVTGLVPQDMPPGFYYLLACIGTNCVASQGTVQILDQALSAIDHTAATTIFSRPPFGEYFPEKTTGTEFSDPFPCPISTHGQYPSTCVWITTPRRVPGKEGTVLWYCPVGNPYPYQVAIGFDPLWQDLTYGFFLKTRPVSFTKYKSDFFGPFSYAGTSGRGYMLMNWTSKERVPRANLQMKFLCTDKKSNSAYP